MENNGKGIFYGVIGVATLIVAIIGATFAYFTATNTNAGTIAGTAATAGLDLSVTAVDGYTSTTNPNLVPQLTSTIGTASSATNKCVDGNGNTVCKVYEVTVGNKGTSAVTIAGTITFSGGTYANLKWGKANEVTGFTATNSAYTALGTSPDTDILVDLKATGTVGTTQLTSTGTSGSTYTFYIIVYIAETTGEQNTTDTGTFQGTVTFNSASADGTATSGVTSTFTA